MVRFEQRFEDGCPFGEPGPVVIEEVPTAGLWFNCMVACMERMRETGNYHERVQLKRQARRFAIVVSETDYELDFNGETLQAAFGEVSERDERLARLAYQMLRDARNKTISLPVLRQRLGLSEKGPLFPKPKPK